MEKFRNELEAQTTSNGWRRHCMTRCDSLGLLFAGATRAHLSVWPLRLHRCIITTTSPSSFISRGTRDDISSLPASTSLTPLSLGLSTSACLAPPGGDSQITAPPWRPRRPPPPRVKSGGGGSERIVLPPEQSQTPSFLPREEAEKAEPLFMPGVAVTCR